MGCTVAFMRSPSFFSASDGCVDVFVDSALIVGFFTSPTGFFGGPAAILAARSLRKDGLLLHKQDSQD